MTVRTKMWVHEGDLTVLRSQDCEDIVESNKKLKAEPQSRKGAFRHIGTIPNVIIEKWLNEESARGHVITELWGAEMDELIARKLRDPDWAYLRTDR